MYVVAYDGTNARHRCGTNRLSVTNRVRLKEKGNYHLRIGYWALNVATVRGPYATPGIDERIDLTEDRVLSYTYDGGPGCWPVDSESTDQDKSTLKSAHGPYHFSLISSAPKKAIGTFKRAINVVPAAVKRGYVWVYLVCVVTFLKFSPDHTGHEQ